MKYKGVIETYREYLPVSENTPVITFYEGNTPLIHSKHLSDLTKCEVYLKFEGANPTGSFKDRGMTMAISKAKEAGKKAVICASTGNTSASAAAYAAQAEMDCVVIIPKGKIALGKLSQAIMHGAKVFEVDGNFDQALNLVRELGEKYPVEIVNSINPYRIEGQKTGTFEICDQLNAVPDYFCLPVGNAGNITAYWKGFKEYYNKKQIDKLPKMTGFQAAGSAPIVLGKPVEKPETIATAIRIGNPASWKTAVAAQEESNGSITAVTDDEIIEAYKLIAAKSGVFCEPASAASVAGLLKRRKEGKLPDQQLVVCVLTGHGLKDPDTAIKSGQKPKSLPCNTSAVIKELGY
ncbi:threonine synthase [candidate division WOR-1 bacterium RIFOXYA12_FULL_43_27]|uniref:Threonine synthase n=1 Tax=candidate division WOR-1 bacterium RIFOXYC2_FULL_46_14 TaxID=1802587 RepID=A0A1F4U671_UNCSA|nr:MAG: threonine synthase [candidate division WOR-1 bacterium RIFOXYA12_FULL_43_27]OGC20581.1 MAG: threonine synthase [candidate division WOR-1 bacterium RIFOXYB2_FULL_46_45]OGC31682.1 MAG: threonine synthase [candidate division WOR-1 bacterium RIFOXYA2_FULL_46_56]OGC40422.1 MAG: threonine synthase [candidate division WOR-1 bacterium RIFOXYC2_FULL_46_14]